MEFLLNLTDTTLIIIMGILGGAICALHFACALAKKNIAKIAQYVNITLHIMLFCALMLSQIGIDVGVAVFMTSIFLYTLISFVKYESDRRSGEGDKGEEGDV